MSFLLTYAAKSRQIAIAGFMADVVAIKAYLIRAIIAEVAGKVALSARRNLAGVFNVNLIFAEPQVVGNRLNYANAIMSQPVVDVWCEGMFSPSIMEDLAKGSKALNNCEVRELKRCIVDGQKGEGFIDILKGKIFRINTNRI